jgi:hypothetical protein
MGSRILDIAVDGNPGFPSPTINRESLIRYRGACCFAAGIFL